MKPRRNPKHKLIKISLKSCKYPVSYTVTSGFSAFCVFMRPNKHNKCILSLKTYTRLYSCMFLVLYGHQLSVIGTI